MATTTNYSWSTPDDTALVSAGASAIRTLGSAIDSTLGGQKNIKQIVNASTTTATSNSTNTYADTTLTATITPTKSTNQVLVVAVHGTSFKSNGNLSNSLFVRLVRGATQLIQMGDMLYTGSTLVNQMQGPTIVYLDSPATTAATTYKTQFYNFSNAASVTVQLGSNPSHIFLFEIGV